MTVAAIIWINDGLAGDIKISDVIISSDDSAHVWGIYNGTYYPAHIMERFPSTSAGVNQMRTKLKHLERQLGSLSSADRFSRCAGCSLNNLQCDLSGPKKLENESHQFVPVKFPEVTRGEEKEKGKVSF